MNHFFHDHIAFPSQLLCFLPCFVIFLGKEGVGRERARERVRDRETERERTKREKRGEMVVVVVVAAFIEALSCAKYRDESFTNVTSFSHQKAYERLIKPHFLIRKLSL